MIGWAGVLYLFLAGIPYQNFLFGLVISMPVILLAGFGISQLWQSKSVAVRVLTGTLVVVSLVGMLLWSYRLIDPFLRVQNHSKVVAQEVESALAPEATLLAFGLTLTLQHYTDLDVKELFYLDPAALQEQVGEGATFFLLLDPGNVREQWIGRTPETNFAWLQENGCTTEILQLAPYTLFQVTPPILNGGNC